VTNSISDFIGKPTTIKANINGIGGLIRITHKGTVRWPIEDDLGAVHIFRIPNTLYAPSAPSRMFSPQHWSQASQDNQSASKGTWCATYDDKVVLHWKGNKHTRTVMLDPATNVAIFRSASGTKGYRVFAAMMDTMGEHHEHNCFSMHAVTDDEASDNEDTPGPCANLPFDLDDDGPLRWPKEKTPTQAKQPSKGLIVDGDSSVSPTTFHDSAAS
jgi:hypothetical protein